ncbi:V-type proton ATPase 16 kDa proteolipid subunit, partial [Termitomyces sp. J132]
SYGTAKSGVCLYYALLLLLQLLISLGRRIYGLVVSVLIAGDLSTTMSLAKGFVQLGAGLSVGLAGLAAGFSIGIVGDAGVRETAQQPKLFVCMILILIFAEVLGLNGLIVALIMNTSAGSMTVCPVLYLPLDANVSKSVLRNFTPTTEAQEF